ncbi:unnamed protein product [Eruca vesicaria subsp. sativa]|uniref:Uncharacterized protein n=1 Tax=Eruca vesicaria subsp. sativa TaxID=29727 RepID=A0ABC8M5U1_ERUVS|nr:unnamed protein product [Eruca vesicaria subsp. sativa]
MGKEVSGLSSLKEENKKRMKELETKLGALEVKELEKRNKKVGSEEEMRDKIENKEKEVDELKEKINDLESNVCRRKSRGESGGDGIKIVELERLIDESVKMIID